MISKIKYGITAILTGLLLLSGPAGPAAAASADSSAVAVSQTLGYILSQQYNAARANTHIFCQASVMKTLAGIIPDGFYLSGTLVAHHEESAGKGSAQGLIIHQDPYQRQLIHHFSATFERTRSIKIIKAQVTPARSMKPQVKLFMVPVQNVSRAELASSTFTGALERVMTHARKMDGSIPADSRPKDYLVVAFLMNQPEKNSRISLIKAELPGSLTALKTGTLLDKDGWQMAVLQDRFAFDSGRELFFNVTIDRPVEKGRMAGVYSSYSLGRRIQKLLAVRGYNPGPVDGRPGQQTIMAAKSFQRDLGLSEDGKLDPPLLRLLLSPKMPKAGILIQQHLTKLGYNIGKIDGVLGPKSMSAIHAFQKKRGLKPSNLITADLFCILSDSAGLVPGPSPEQGSDRASGSTGRINRFKDRMWPNTAKDR